MSRYAYCCIVKQLITYINNNQLQLKVEIKNFTSKLLPINKNTHIKYVKMNEIKDQIKNNLIIDPIVFSNVVSTNSDINQLLSFYNTNFANSSTFNYTENCND